MKDSELSIRNHRGKVCKGISTKPVGEFILFPRQTTRIIHWPMFIEMDYNLYIARVEGIFN